MYLLQHSHHEVMKLHSLRTAVKMDLYIFLKIK
uniref:Uncharacterized protein n=1 Tax=Anguilla anguilla TaxID=7936 RepID=A0A0E9WI92_ANGAN